MSFKVGDAVSWSVEGMWGCGEVLEINDEWLTISLGELKNRGIDLNIPFKNCAPIGEMEPSSDQKIFRCEIMFLHKHLPDSWPAVKVGRGLGPSMTKEQWIKRGMRA